ncbi:hemin uptake protein HemP [Marichromatium bheemlicum]|uniref:Hemin uptake protein HemP n=1 Tax=Marichromatium bheemlicum TaxID=365339 RepID=A0ABX1I6H0_9GAMM|nr:hemin uptake protein HemP [Marichromatium bheemlicum]NKN32798.1 hemin uptake protein HemP [Marichromatium bheemlicum]
MQPPSVGERRRQRQPLSVYSAELLAHDRELLIIHRGARYRLRAAPRGRLELLGPEPEHVER